VGNCKTATWQRIFCAGGARAPIRWTRIMSSQVRR
jgi:hypothetical protein